MKKFLTGCLSFLFTTAIYSQQASIDSALMPKPFLHYLQEYNFNKSANPESWNRQKPGLHLSFASTDESYFRIEVPENATDHHHRRSYRKSIVDLPTRPNTTR